MALPFFTCLTVRHFNGLLINRHRHLDGYNDDIRIFLDSLANCLDFYRDVMEYPRGRATEKAFAANGVDEAKQRLPLNHVEGVFHGFVGSKSQSMLFCNKNY